jgi:protein-tyrosine kinase
VPIQASLASSAAVSARAAPRARTQVTLDLAGLREFGYLVPDQVRSEMAEQFRHLKRPLLKNARAGDTAIEQRGTLIMMTSAMPGEGKTFCSINLAMSMAMEVDTAVILVDADVVRPSVFARMGIDAKPPGLLDLLNRDDLELDDALVATNVPKLLLMASGDPNGRSTELLASASMDRILTKLATDYSDHIVIFDAPPVLLTTESTVLASKVGQVVMVVEAAKTARHTVEMAFAALRHCPIVLSVLNKCDEPSDAKRYGYYYG